MIPRTELQISSVSNLCFEARTNFLQSIEPALHVNTLGQFLKWTQEELQIVFPHDKLVCGVGNLGKNGAQIRQVITRNFPQEYIQTLQQPFGMTSSPILVKWLKVRQPILFELDSGIDLNALPSKWLDNFRKFELINLAAHGLCDIDSHTASYFSFSSIPGSLNSSHSHMLKLLVPYLHTALTRVLSNKKLKTERTPNKRAELTARQKEILQWLSTGKSNWEIAQVIGLSEATVKNHVHEVLVKLHVHTRAQAVVKAIHLKLLSASKNFPSA